MTQELKGLMERLQRWLDNEPMLSPGEATLLTETIASLAAMEKREEELEQLRKLSCEATPGPWEYEEDREGCSMGWIGCQIPAGRSTVFSSMFEVEGDSGQQATNAEFVVACINFVRTALQAKGGEA